MAEHLARQLHRIRRDMLELAEKIFLHLEQHEEFDDMAPIDLSAFTALGARIDAVAAEIPADVAGAGSGNAAAISAGVSSSLSGALSTALSTDQSSADSTATSLGVQVSNLEVAGGVTSSIPGTSLSGVSSSLTSTSTSLSGVSTSLPTTGVVAISPVNVSGPVGGPLTQQLSASGGTGPYTFAIDTTQPPPPSDVTLSAAGVLSIGGQSAESGSVSVIATDSTGLASPSVAIAISVA